MSIIPGGGYRRGSGIFDPFFHELADPFEGQLSRAYAGGGGGGGSMMMMMGMAGTQIDWKETAEAHVFKADLPGVRKEEVKVEVEEGGVLQISGERTREQEDKSDTWHRVERSTGKFCRRFRLPDNARLDDVRAAMEHGVLTVVVPKVLDRNKRRNVKSIIIN